MTSDRCNDPGATVERVRRVLMKRVAIESTAHHIVTRPGEGQWQPFLPGIDLKVLDARGGIMSYLLKFAPGAVLPAHRHPADEECMVMEGTLRMGNLVLPTGSFHKALQNMLDADCTSDDGAVIYLRGVPPQAEHLV